MDWKDMSYASGMIGMVYMITEKSTGMIYIGIKKFKKKVTLPPLKGRKNKRHKLVESDWRTYNSSNKELAKKIEKNPKNYDKKVIRCCETVTEMKAVECFYQLEYYMSGNWDLLINEVINLRLRVRKGEKKWDY